MLNSINFSMKLRHSLAFHIDNNIRNITSYHDFFAKVKPDDTQIFLTVEDEEGNGDKTINIVILRPVKLEFTEYQPAAKIIQTADTVSGKLEVKEENQMQTLYLNGVPLDITDRFVDFKKIEPWADKNSEIFWVGQSAGGSGTPPYYVFLKTNRDGKPDITENIGSEPMEDIKSDGNIITVKFGDVVNRFDGSIVERGYTLTYGNGKIVKSTQIESDKINAKNILKKQWTVTKTLQSGDNIVFFFFSEKCGAGKGDLRMSEIRGSAGEDDLSGTEKLLEKGCWKADMKTKQIIYVNLQSKIIPMIQNFNGAVGWQELSDLSQAN